MKRPSAYRKLARPRLRSRHAILPVLTLTAVNGAGPKSPLDPKTRSPTRTQLPKCTRINPCTQTCSTVVLSPLRVSLSARLPPPSADETKSRFAAPHTAVLVLRPNSVGCGWLHNNSPLFGSTPTISPNINSTICSCPSTLIRIGEEVEFLKSCFRQTTAPSF